MKIIKIFFLFTISFTTSHFISKNIKLNQANTYLEKGDYASIELLQPNPVIWSVQVLDNYSTKTSVVTSSWDTIMRLPQGSLITYSFWKNFKNGKQQITNLTSFNNSKVLATCFSPAAKADTIINTAGYVLLNRYESVEHLSKGMTTIRISSYNNNSLLVYCFFGKDSIIPLALNTSYSQMPDFYRNIKDLKLIKDNSHEFRNRWNNDKLFFVCLPIKKDSVQIEFFPG